MESPGERRQPSIEFGVDTVDGTTFSRWPSRWIPWGIEVMARLEQQESLFRPDVSPERFQEGGGDCGTK